jgi:hypothetical protein
MSAIRRQWSKSSLTSVSRLSPQAHWVRVGDNAEMTALGDYDLHDCPYPLTSALERFKVRHEFKYATLVHYRDDGVFLTLPAWFQHYNQRQPILVKRFAV